MSNRTTHEQVLKGQLEVFGGLLDRSDVFEVVVNTPGELWFETRQGWTRQAQPGLTFEALTRLARTVATYSAQSLDETRPLLSASLPDGERIQIVMPPAVRPTTMSITIRKPSATTFTLAELAKTELFCDVARAADCGGNTKDDDELAQRLSGGDVAGFLTMAVLKRKNIIISGATGSGKTTLSKALIAIVPSDERIITIEDTSELVIPQPNHVRLFYSKGGQGASTVRAKDLLESCLRMRPDRIMLQELRDGTAFDYLRNVNSGHPGSITTVHANNCELAFEQLTLLVKESDGGRGLDRTAIRQMLERLVDVVVQCKRVDGTFRVTEIWFSGDTRPTATFKKG